MDAYLLLSMFFHVMWVAFLYVCLTVVRAPAVWGVGKNSPYRSSLECLEPKISANLSNQFEWPLLFYVICALEYLSGPEVLGIFVAIAWIFIIGRILHSFVQIFTSNIRLRGAVFTINFLAVVAMWCISLGTSITQ